MNIFKTEADAKVPHESKDLVVRFDSPVDPPLWGFPRRDEMVIKNTQPGAVRRTK
jgi:hypothetical protein